MSWFNSILLWAAICTISALVYSATYNAFFHPFSRVPGPRINSISRFPWIRDWLSGNLHKSVKKMHERYGEVVRIAPDELSFISPGAWNDIYGIKSGKSFVRDPKWYANLTEGQDDIIVANETKHAHFRKIFSPFFSDKSIRQNEPVIRRNIDLLVERLKDHIKGTDGVADMVKWYNWTTFDIIGDLLYGEPFDCLKNAEYHPWLAVVLQNIRLSSYIALMERYSFLKKLVMALLPQNLLEKRNMHLDVIRDKCRRHDGKGTDHSIVGSIDPANASLTEGELEANLALMTMAGSETSATTMSAATYYLATNETAASKVAEEIRSAFKGELDISWAAVQKLPYLNAVIKETLRLYPPTPVGLPRRVISKGETVIGHFIPKDMVVYITQYSAYRSQSNFREPDKFRPERWLDDPAFKGDNLDAVQPFITGPYSCIGKSLAYMEVSLVLARMLWNFDWQAGEKDLSFEDEKVYALWQKSTLNIRFTLPSTE
ncbi:Ff.00g099600.m01.CDS01 [Fusarium sp. VM40]|nr:Ff.00g099600.m01.CDS01 [Fusarium sp. VM40]